MPQNLNKFLKDRRYFWPCLEPPARTPDEIARIGEQLVASCAAWQPPMDQVGDAELIRRARIRGWTNALRREAPAESAYALSRAFNREKLKSYPSGTKATRTFDHHVAERHAPNSVTLEKVSRVLGRPAHSELCPLIWIGLDLSIDIADVGPLLVAGTLGLDSMPLQRALRILIPDATLPGHWLVPPPLHLRGLARVETLGALILLVRLSKTYNCDPETSSSLATSLAEWLVVLGVELQERGIAADVFGLCAHRLLPSLNVQSESINELALLSAAVNVDALRDRASQSCWSWSDRLEAMTQFFEDWERAVLAEAVHMLQHEIRATGAKRGPDEPATA